MSRFESTKRWFLSAAIGGLTATGCGTLHTAKVARPGWPMANKQPSAPVVNPAVAPVVNPAVAPVVNPAVAPVAGTGTTPAIQQVGLHVAARRGGGCVAGPCTGGGNGCGNVYGDGCGNAPPPPWAAADAIPPAPFANDPNEFLCNGWDDPPRAYVQRNDAIGGLNPTDVAVSFTTESGDIELSTSNEVCVYAPRFASVRKITGAVSGEHAVGLSGARRDVSLAAANLNQGGFEIDRTVQLGHADVARRLDAFRDRDRGVPIERIESVVQSVDVLAALANIRSDALADATDVQLALLQRHALEATTYTVDQLIDVSILDLAAPAIKRAQAAEEFVVYEFPDAGRLEVLKVVDRLDAAPGDTVTFSITARNVGDSPVRQIRLADNLTTRLEYLESSEQSTPDAEFTSIANEVGSVRLIWNFDEPLPVGETVTVRFKCRVR